MAKIRVFFRIAILMLSLLFIVPWFALTQLILGHNYHRSVRHRMKYARFILWVLGVEIEKTGEVPTEPVLFVANHRCWLDPVLSFHAPMLVVAKAEVGNWPLIGFGCQMCGAIFVQRDKKSSRKQTLVEMLTQLKEGFSVLIYAEGTTNGAPTTKEFRLGGFRLAAEHGIPIAPIALEYQNHSDYWINNDLFIPHAMRTFGRRKTQVKIHYGEVQRGKDPELLAENTQNLIDEKLTEMRKDWFIDTEESQKIT